MMGGFASGDSPGPPQGGGNFFSNFFNPQESMKMEGVVEEGESKFQDSSRLIQN